MPDHTIRPCWDAAMPLRTNNEGARMIFGSGRTSTVLYCGRRLGRDLIPRSDGQCGPINGPQCRSCTQGPTAPMFYQLNRGIVPSGGVRIRRHASLESDQVCPIPTCIVPSIFTPRTAGYFLGSSARLSKIEFPFAGWLRAVGFLSWRCHPSAEGSRRRVAQGDLDGARPPPPPPSPA